MTYGDGERPRDPGKVKGKVEGTDIRNGMGTKKNRQWTEVQGLGLNVKVLNTLLGIPKKLKVGFFWQTQTDEYKMSYVSKCSQQNNCIKYQVN